MSSAEQSQAVAVPVISPAPDSLVRELSTSTRIDALEARLREMPQAEMPITNRFTKGLYVREIFIPAGTLLTSKIHKTEHPYVISKGSISVWTPLEGVRRFTAPYTGITKPGTRRVLFAHEDVVWTTFHPTDETDLDRLEAELILPHDPGAGHEVTPAETEAIDSLFLRLLEDFHGAKMLASGHEIEQESGKPMNTINGGAS